MSDSRDHIINRIRKALKGRAPVPLPLLEVSRTEPSLERFETALAKAGARYQRLADAGAALQYMKGLHPGESRWISCLPEQREGLDLAEGMDIKTLFPLEWAMVKGRFGVEENGAIWIEGGDLPHRMIPFMCETLAVVLDARQLVADMGQAYERIRGVRYDYGCFIAGPSKTADIEQTLVTGAQGPKALWVLVVG